MKLLDPKVGPSATYNPIDDRRFYAVRDLIYKYGLLPPVQVFGEKAPFEELLEKELGIQFKYTNFDLNYPFPKMDKASVLLCFEVIEHLLNPLLFLLEIRKIMWPESLLYLSYPIQPYAFWSPCHFHEYDKSRFLYLLREAGLSIVDYQELKLWKRITGIRPIIRNTPLGRLKIQLYVLKKGRLRCDME